MFNRTELIQALKETIDDYFASRAFLEYTRFELEHYQPEDRWVNPEKQMRIIQSTLKLQAA